MIVRYDPVHPRFDERNGHVYCTSCDKHVRKFCCLGKCAEPLDTVTEAEPPMCEVHGSGHLYGSPACDLETDKTDGQSS